MTPAVEEPYACPDIVFVLDSSNSLSWSDWHHQLAMVNQVVKRLEKVSNNLSWSDGHHQLAMVNQVVKQGRIHGYPCRVQVGRGREEIDQPRSWAGAVTQNRP